MSEAKKQMDRAIKKILIPILRDKKFQGTFPHFFREQNNHIDLLTFQFNKYGGSFIVEISYADKDRKNIYIYKDLPFNKLRSYQTKERLRLGSEPEKGKTDHWFQYNKKSFLFHSNVFENVAKEVIPFLEKQAEDWWRSKYNRYSFTNSNFMNYKHTQIGYLMIVVTLVVSVLFVRAHDMAAAEPPSIDSGSNFLVTAIMAFILIVLTSFWSLQVIIDEKYIRVKFGYGIYKKKFLLEDVLSAKTVKNRWYYGWGIRGWLWPKMWIYNVSGFNAVEIKLKNGKTYRIGTDEPKKLEQAILNSIG